MGWLFLLVVAIGAGMWIANEIGETASIEVNEEVVFFRTNASLGPDSASWEVPIHGWVFEPERSSIKRKAALTGLVKLLDLPPSSVGETIFL
ncbi:MAG: hypothetical protein HY815_04125, partial [Candidatus Riflebacteria bacterium]|nr:hypothetical protein [Candidatus Riflebacteria bacterium]